MAQYLRLPITKYERLRHLAACMSRDAHAAVEAMAGQHETNVLAATAAEDDAEEWDNLIMALDEAFQNPINLDE